MHLDDRVHWENNRSNSHESTSSTHTNEMHPLR